MSLPIYIDIDGTMTDYFQQGGKPRQDVIDKVKTLCETEEVVIWTGGGTDYARKFCKEHGIEPTVIIGKPRLCVDDCPTIRPHGRFKIVTPEEFLEL